MTLLEIYLYGVLAVLAFSGLMLALRGFLYWGNAWGESAWPRAVEVVSCGSVALLWPVVVALLVLLVLVLGLAVAFGWVHRKLTVPPPAPPRTIPARPRLVRPSR